MDKSGHGVGAGVGVLTALTFKEGEYAPNPMAAVNTTMIVRARNVFMV